MNIIYHKPDSLRFTHQLSKNLKIFAHFKMPGFLKVTSKGFQHISRIQALFQAIKGKLGFTNYCAANLIQYHVRKLLFEVEITGNETFKSELRQIQSNHFLSHRYRKVHELFMMSVSDPRPLKQKLIEDFQQLRPCFWNRLFHKAPKFHPEDFGLSALAQTLQGETVEEGIGYFTRLLKMDLSDTLIVDHFKPQFERYLKQNRIPNTLEFSIAPLQLRIALAEFNIGDYDGAQYTHSSILKSKQIEKWPHALLEKFFQQLLDCKDHVLFFQLYRLAASVKLPREKFRLQYIKLATHFQTDRKGLKKLLQLAFDEASPDQITASFTHQFLTCYPEPKDKLNAYFRIRHKSPLAVQNIPAPWDPIKTSEEVLACKELCITNEDHHELNKVYLERKIQEALSLLKTTTMDLILFRAGSKKEKALQELRKVFQAANHSDYLPAWISIYLNLLYKRKDAQEELDQVVLKILNSCLLSTESPELLETIFPYLTKERIANYGDKLGTFIKNTSLHCAEKLQFVEKILRQGPHPYLLFLKGDWLGNAETHERLTAYRLAYTYSPRNGMDESMPFYRREILDDQQVKLSDIPMYRQLALEAGCLPK